MDDGGFSGGISSKGKTYGTGYTTLHQLGNIKFVRYNDAKSAKTPMETMTKGRVYVTVDNRNNLSAITYYDKAHKRTKQIDLTKAHRGMQPHTHHGYFHNENDGPKGAARPTTKEKQMVALAKRAWYNKNGKQ